MKKTKFSFADNFDYNKHFPLYSKDEIKLRVELKFEKMDYCDMRDIKYAGETEEYILFTGREYYPGNKHEDKKIILTYKGNIFVIPAEQEIIRPFKHQRLVNKSGYGMGNISCTRLKKKHKEELGKYIARKVEVR